MARHCAHADCAIRLKDWNRFARAESKSKSLRGANFAAIITKAGSLVLRIRTRPDFFASNERRCYARCQTGNRSTHRVPDPYARAQRVKTFAAALRASYSGARTSATDCTGGSRSAAVVLDDRSAAGTRAGAGNSSARSRVRGVDPARISMHLFFTGKLDRVGRRRSVIQLRFGQPGCARAVRQLSPQRKRAIGLHPAGGWHAEPAAANHLQRHCLHAARTGYNPSGRNRTPATLEDHTVDDGMRALRVQLKRLIEKSLQIRRDRRACLDVTDCR